METSANQSVPVIRHQDVAAEQVSQVTAGFINHLKDHLKFSIIKIPAILLQIAGSEKDLVRKTRTMNIGHGKAVGTNLRLPRKAHGSRKALTVATDRLRTVFGKTSGGSTDWVVRL